MKLILKNPVLLIPKGRILLIPLESNKKCGFLINVVFQPLSKYQIIAKYLPFLENHPDTGSGVRSMGDRYGPRSLKQSRCTGQTMKYQHDTKEWSADEECRRGICLFHPHTN